MGQNISKNLDDVPKSEGRILFYVACGPCKIRNRRLFRNYPRAYGLWDNKKETEPQRV
jgi:hypothetical protein